MPTLCWNIDYQICLNIFGGSTNAPMVALERTDSENVRYSMDSSRSVFLTWNSRSRLIDYKRLFLFFYPTMERSISELGRGPSSRG